VLATLGAFPPGPPPSLAPLSPVIAVTPGCRRSAVAVSFVTGCTCRACVAGVLLLRSYALVLSLFQRCCCADSALMEMSVLHRCYLFCINYVEVSDTYMREDSPIAYILFSCCLHALCSAMRNTKPTSEMSVDTYENGGIIDQIVAAGECVNTPGRWSNPIPVKERELTMLSYVEPQAITKPVSLFEQYRPKNWSEVVGQDRVIARISQLRRRGLSGRCYWLTGSSGSGKSSIARLIASEVADEWSTEELDAQWCTPSRLSEIERQSNTRPLGGRGWAFVVNESHALSTAAVRQLLVATERLSPWSTWVFTTTTESQETFESGTDAAPLLSRCIVLPLARRDLARAFAERCRQVAIAERLDGRPIEDYLALAKRCRNNLRQMLCEVESGAMLGSTMCAK